MAPRMGTLVSFHAKHVHVTAPEALEGEQRAAKQESAILEWFRVRDRYRADQPRWTPSDVHAAFPQWPITSIRRALTNLCTVSPRRPAPPLRHYRADRRPGPRGARESTWGLA